MELTLQRTEKRRGYTMGTLAVDGEPFCDTLEPTDAPPSPKDVIRW